MDDHVEDRADEEMFKIPKSFYRVTLNQYGATLSWVAANRGKHLDKTWCLTYRGPNEPSAERYRVKGPEDVRWLSKQIESIVAEMKQRPCPLCGGNMVNIAPLLAFDLMIGGGSGGSTHAELKGHQFVVPNDWECQQCFAYTVRGPAKKEKGWTRDAAPASPNSFATRVFERLPQVSEVMPQRQGPMKCQPGWYLRVTEEWLFLNGPKDDVLFGLGIA